jgi:hypothetical protein
MALRAFTVAEIVVAVDAFSTGHAPPQPDRHNDTACGAGDRPHPLNGRAHSFVPEGVDGILTGADVHQRDKGGLATSATATAMTTLTAFSETCATKDGPENRRPSIDAGDVPLDSNSRASGP